MRPLALCALLLPLLAAAPARGRRAPVEVVALCPDAFFTPEVFAARKGPALGEQLPQGRFQIVPVDPWAGRAARERGLAGVIEESFPALLEELAADDDDGRITWIGHGLCGLLPLAAQRDDVRWVALSTRLDGTVSGPLLRDWWRSWAAGESPDEALSRQLLLSGARGGERARLDDPRPGAHLAVALRSHLRPPPPAVARDVVRWLEDGTLLDAVGAPLLPAPSAWRGPGLILTGASSSAAPPESILPAFGATAEDQAISYRMFSRINGHLADYGHGDVLLSWHSPWDLDPLLWGWLRDCDHGAQPGCADHRLKLEQRGGRRSLRQPGHGSRSR